MKAKLASHESKAIEQSKSSQDIRHDLPFFSELQVLLLNMEQAEHA